MRRRNLVVLVVIAVAGIGAGFSAALLVTGRNASEAPRAAAASLPGPTGVVGGFPLDRMPWYYQPHGSPTAAESPNYPSVEFPRGVSYPAALRSLYTSLMERGGLPSAAAVRPPLPQGVVLMAPSGPSGVRVSLTAPFGWDSGTGNVLPPSYSLPGHISPEELLRRREAARASGRAPPEGAAIDVPRLRPCQVLAPGERPAAAAQGC